MYSLCLNNTSQTVHPPWCCMFQQASLQPRLWDMDFRLQSQTGLQPRFAWWDGGLWGSCFNIRGEGERSPAFGIRHWTIKLQKCPMCYKIFPFCSCFLILVLKQKTLQEIVTLGWTTGTPGSIWRMPWTYLSGGGRIAAEHSHVS